MGGENPAQPSLCGALPNVREELQKGVSPREGCCRDCDGGSTKLSSRPGFPPAFPPHCALDPGSEIPKK